MIDDKNTLISEDLLIIGAGPVGLFAAFQAHLCGLGCVIVDSLSQVGGQCNELYPDKPIFDIPAIPKCNARELIHKLEQQLDPFDTSIFLDTTIVAVKNTEVSSIIKEKKDYKHDRKWEAITNNQHKILVDYIILATGAGLPTPQKLSVEHSSSILDKHIHYSVKKINQFDNQRIIILGGGDSAIDWALNLCNRTHLTLVHRREKFTAQPGKVEILKNAIQNKLLNFYVATLKRLICDKNGNLTNIELFSNTGGSIFIKTDHVLVLFGLVLTPCPIIFHNYKIETFGNLIAVDPCSFQTSVEHVFACGDAVTYPNKQKLILSGFHEASLAMRSILAEKTRGKNIIRHSSSNKNLLRIYNNQEHS